MRESIKVIKWSSGFSILFLFLTYIVSVNEEIHFIALNLSWLSNSFFLTLFGGAFASMLVVDLCELQRYISAKSNAEQYLFSQGLYLYQTLNQMITFARDYMENTEWSIPENLFDGFSNELQRETMSLKMTDYATFKHSKESLMYVHAHFCEKDISKIQRLVKSDTKLRLAINETQKERLEHQLENHDYTGTINAVTASSPRVEKVLRDTIEKATDAVAMSDAYLTFLDSNCRNRFKWSQIKDSLKFPHLEELSIEEEIIC